MRVAICTVQVPFVRGGAEACVEGLHHAILKNGHEAEIISIPFKWYPPVEIIRQMLIWELLDLTEASGKTIDLVIALKFPAYLVTHPNKVVWLIHQHRQAYDLWGTEYGDLRGEEGSRVREIIHQADSRALREARRVFTISQNVSARLLKYNMISSEPLYPPVRNRERFSCDKYGDYIFCPGRLEALKRQKLLIEAMALVRSGANCLIAGVGGQESELRHLCDRQGVAGKVKIISPATDAQIADFYANALAVFFGPFQEDYGFVTVESLYSRKPVITLTDSGGPLEFIQDGVNGMVVSPNPEAIAKAIDTLFNDRAQARTMGERGYQAADKMRMEWPRVVRNLLS
jgi:glycosyltransferase involved in cell wall biosynthesis